MTILNKVSTEIWYNDCIVSTETPKYCVVLQIRFSPVVLKGNKYNMRKYETYATPSNTFSLTKTVTRHYLNKYPFLGGAEYDNIK